MHRRRTLVLPFLLAAGAVVAGCSAPAQAPVSQTDPTLVQLRQKIDLIQQDECVTRPAADVYPSCPRFIGEVTGVASSADGQARGPGPLKTAAAQLATDAGTFSQTGCVAVPGSAPASPPACAADLERVRADLAAVATALGQLG